MVPLLPTLATIVRLLFLGRRVRLPFLHATGVNRQPPSASASLERPCLPRQASRSLACVSMPISCSGPSAPGLRTEPLPAWLVFLVLVDSLGCSDLPTSPCSTRRAGWPPSHAHAALATGFDGILAESSLFQPPNSAVSLWALVFLTCLFTAPIFSLFLGSGCVLLDGRPSLGSRYTPTCV